MYSLSFKSSFIPTCWLNAATSSTSTKHDFNVFSTFLSLRDFVLFPVLSVTKSFNYLNLALWICYRRKNKTIKIKPWFFHSATTVHAEDEQRFSKASEICAFYSFDTRPSNEPVQLLTWNVFLFLRLKTYNKHLISLEFSVGTLV